MKEGVEMRLFASALAIVLIGSSISGCDSIKGLTGSGKKIQKQSVEIDHLRSEVEDLKKQVNNISNEQARLAVDNFLQQMDSVAYLTPGDSGYSVVESNIGKLTVQMSNIRPYANGSKITLKFGNPLAAEITGLKVTLEWGSVDGKGAPIKDSTKKQNFTFSENIKSGAWTKVPVVLSGITPSNLGFVRIKNVNHTGLRLHE